MTAPRLPRFGGWSAGHIPFTDQMAYEWAHSFSLKLAGGFGSRPLSGAA